ncbi:MAG: class I SAM-dependent methyltransferase [Candidatus Woesearchaeota archaeon]
MVKKGSKGKSNKESDKGLLKYTSHSILAYKTRPEPEFVAFLSELKDRGKVLDIGCGIGLESGFAKDLGFDVVGIDKDYGCIKKAKELNANVDFKQVDFFNYIKDIKKNEFSIIIDSKFSNKLPLNKLKRYYKNISKILKYGGYMYLQALSTEDAYCIKHCPRRMWTKIDDLYIRYFSKKKLQKLLRLTGLKIESFKTIKQKRCNDEEGCEEETYNIAVARQIVKKW